VLLPAPSQLVGNADIARLLPWGIFAQAKSFGKFQCFCFFSGKHDEKLDVLPTQDVIVTTRIITLVLGNPYI